MEWLPIVHREFWDVPRYFVVVADGVAHLLWSEFLDDRDEYSDRYRVVVLDPAVPADPPTPVWVDPTSGGYEVGSVPVADVVFDPTRRRAVDGRLRTTPAALSR